MSPFITKHDEYAYQGKMDMLTLSKLLEWLVEYTYELEEETVNESGQELLNLQRYARSKALQDVRQEIERQAERRLDVDNEHFEFWWNVKKEDLKSQYKEFENEGQ